MRAFAIVALSAVLAGCAVPKPTNIVLGEACERCRRPIDNAKVAAEQVAPNGLGLKFRTAHCMATWIAEKMVCLGFNKLISSHVAGPTFRIISALYTSCGE